MGYKGYGQWGTGVWGLWAMGHRGYGPHRQWVTWPMGHMGNGAYGPWAIGTFLPIASLLLDGFLQKLTGHRY